MKYLFLLLVCPYLLVASTLRVSNFVDYIDIEVLKEFASQNGVEIIYDTHASSEEAYAKILKGDNAYDVVIITSHYIQKLQNEGLIVKLEKEQLSHYKNLNQEFLKKYFYNVDDYSVTYLWGSIGLYLNQKKISGKFSSWNNLWEANLKESVLISNEPLDVFAVALKSLGFSANTTNAQEIKQAYEKLLLLIPNIKEISSGNVPTYFTQNDFMAGMMFSGDAKVISDELSYYKYVYPNEGAIIWADGMVIPKNSSNKQLAHAFINFIIDSKISGKIASYTGYALANDEAKKYISPKDLKDNRVYPSSLELENSEILSNHSQTHELILEYWKQFIQKYNAHKGAINEK
jgi:spermidine/putrescine transport system substrate-binding protein